MEFIGIAIIVGALLLASYGMCFWMIIQAWHEEPWAVFAGVLLFVIMIGLTVGTYGAVIHDHPTISLNAKGCSRTESHLITQSIRGRA